MNKEKRAQKFTELEILRKAFAEIHSNKDLRRQSCKYELVFSLQMHHIKQE
jgi:hypothetical protein